MKVPVLVPKIFNFPFTYETGQLNNLKPGDFVKVPFGKAEEIGVVWDKIQPSEKKFSIKTISSKIEGVSINQSLIKFINLFSDYNLVSKGMVLKMCIGDKKNISKFEDIEEQILKKTNKNFVLNEGQKKSLSEISKNKEKFN